jgi:cyclin D1/2/4, plant
MAPSSYEMAASTLLCGEASSSILDLEAVAQEEEEVLLARSRTRREPSVVFPVPSEDCVAGFVEAEARTCHGRTTPRRCAAGARISASKRTPSTGFGRWGALLGQCSLR